MQENLRRESSFGKRVIAIVSQIPYGMVMTYGQIAAIAGNARAARIVGGIAHYGDSKLPWHRVVNRSGGLASGFPGGREYHKKLLMSEQVEFEIDKNGEAVVSLVEHLWIPEK